MTPMELLKDYIDNHDIGLRTSSIECHYRPAIVLFLRATNCQDVSTIDRNTVNGFVDWLRVQDLAQETKRSRRRGLLTLLQYAFDQGYLTDPLYRIKKIQVPRRMPRAWSIVQVQTLLETVEELDRPPICRIPAWLWWSSLVCTGWDTGLRLGDLLSLERDWIDQYGILRIVQSKTQREHIAQVNPSTMELISEMRKLTASKLVWPMDYPRRKFFSEFRDIVREAGLTGTFRYIRRGAVTHAELIEPGLG
jgi:integrase